MSCTCKNPDGTLSEICFGICNKNNYEIINEMNKRYNAIEDLLNVFLDKLNDRLRRMEECSDEKYQEGMKDGFIMARNIYE